MTEPAYLTVEQAKELVRLLNEFINHLPPQYPAQHYVRQQAIDAVFDAAAVAKRHAQRDPSVLTPILGNLP